MKPIVRYALLLSAVVIAGGGIAAAQMDKKAVAPAQQQQRYAKQNSSYSHRVPRFFQYDLNHDGRVTRDELNGSLAQQFAQISGSAPTFGKAQFNAARMKTLSVRARQMFHRADWNGDGKLSLEEYLISERERFERADRDGAGFVSCGASQQPKTTSRHGRQHGGGRGFCKVADLNKDGKVTRGEFDKAMQQEFTTAAKGGMLSAENYFAMLAAHVQAANEKRFARLDKNGDGKVDRAEFASSQVQYFERLDRNHDGTITRDEFYAGRRAASLSTGARDRA